MQKKHFALLVILFFLVGTSIILVSRFFPARENQTILDQKNISSNSKIDIAVSIYPAAHVLEKVGGDLVNIHLITPGGIEPHEYEPTANDIIRIESSKALVYNGGGIDVWADRMAQDLLKKNIQVLKMIGHIGVEIIKLPEGEEDPHIWLDPVLMQRHVESVVQLLTVISPEQKTTFEANGAAYLAELSLLDQEFKTGLARCQLRDIVSSHNAFNYMASRYNFTVHAIAGISPDAEPSPAQMSTLTRLIKSKGIKVVFFESLVSPKLSEVLAKEANAEVMVLDPIEGLSSEAVQAKANYETLMRGNLESLRRAMLCH